MDDPDHYSDELHLLLDGRLDDAMKAVVEAHLTACKLCSDEYSRLQSARRALRALPRSGPPAQLWLQVQSALDAEHAAQRARAARRARRGWQVAAALLAGLLLVWLSFNRQRTPDMMNDVVAATVNIATPTLPLTLVTGDPAALEQHFRDSGLSFRSRVLDLRMMRYELLGGRRHQVDGHPSALFVYRGLAGERVICQMFVAEILRFTARAAVRESGGMKFYIQRRGNITAVFWSEGNVVCVLASTMDSDSVIALAMAKAMKV